MSMIFTDLIKDIKTWIGINFRRPETGQIFLELESVEVNPILFRRINETIQKEILSRTIGDTEIRFIDGVKLIKSTDPLSGIHFKLKEVAEDEAI